MLNTEKFMHKPFFEREPLCDHECHMHHEKPRYTMTEEVEHATRLMRETIDRLLRFEQRLKDEVATLSKTLMSDNVIFKNTMHESWNTFLMEVKNEVNIFESTTTAELNAFKAELESNYATLSENVRKQIVDSLEEYEAKLADTIKTINERIEQNNNVHAEAFAEFQRNITTQLNTFEQTINAQMNNFMESVNTTLHSFKDAWETIMETRLNSQDAKLADAEMYMKTNLTATVTTLIGDMHANGEFEDIIEGEVFNDLQRKVDGFGKISIKYFGAMGDGVTDDTAAFKLAVSAHRNIYIPRGEYKISETIVIPANTKIVIIGDYKQTIIHFDGTGNAFENNGELLMSDIWVEGNKTNENGMLNNGNLKLIRCQFNANGENGLMFSESVHSVHNIIDDCVFYANVKNGIHCVTNIDAQKTSIRILNSYCCRNGAMTNEAIAQTNGNGNGILLGACLGVSVMNTVCEYNHGAGILIRNDGKYGVFNITAIGNYFEGNRYANIYVNNDDATLAYKEIFIKGNYYSVYPVTDGVFCEGSLLGQSAKTVIRNASAITESFIDEEFFNKEIQRKEKAVVYAEHGTVDAGSFVSKFVTVDNLDKTRGLHVTSLGQMPFGTIIQACYTENDNEIRIDVMNIKNESVYVASRGFLIETTY